MNNSSIDRKKIESSDAPKAIGPYSQAIAMGNIVYLSDLRFKIGLKYFVSLNKLMKK